MISQSSNKSLKSFNNYFSNRYIKELIKTKNPEAIFESARSLGLVLPTSTFSLYDVYEKIYEMISINYKNEYIFKNILTKKVLEGIHSSEKSVILTELRVANCKADLAVFNGTSSVYEIKTDLDNFSRLDRQLQAYRLFFDHISVVTTPSQLHNLSRHIDNTIGVLIVHDDGRVETAHEPLSNLENIDVSILFDTLRKSEYMRIISHLYGSVPEAPNTKIYEECKHLFCRLPIKIAHQQVIEVLRERGEFLKLFVNNVPYMFKGYAVGSNLTKKEQKIFCTMM